MTATATLTSRLREIGTPHVERWLDLPLVTAIGRGDVDLELFRYYLEQDYLYITSYVRLYAKLAASAPDEHVTHLVELAWNMADTELAHHRKLGETFGCRFDDAKPSATCSAYVSFLQSAAEDFGLGLVAMLPCSWGYGLLCRTMPLPPDGPLRGWVELYRSDRFAHILDRHFAMVDAADVDPTAAEALFIEGLAHEVAFWNQTP